MFPQRPKMMLLPYLKFKSWNLGLWKTLSWAFKPFVVRGVACFKLTAVIGGVKALWRWQKCSWRPLLWRNTKCGVREFLVWDIETSFKCQGKNIRDPLKSVYESPLVKFLFLCSSQLLFLRMRFAAAGIIVPPWQLPRTSWSTASRIWLACLLFCF